MRADVCRFGPIDRPLKLVDRAGEFVRWVQPDEAAARLDSGQFVALGTRKRIRAVRWVGPEPEQMERRAYPIRPHGFGDAHKHESYWNPRGVWTLDGIPETAKPIFTRVLDECLKEAA